ncbi:hypothetical protein E2C01_063085 [Portunus trituberculatus]|uniref:Uncharacterized protein n=1 Tax=Portunus trituberculatus TaxID=210409 RepID=A0A5B7HH61_PORTR|nr:hypothetical protein [Portunus trituberculatus]
MSCCEASAPPPSRGGGAPHHILAWQPRDRLFIGGEDLSLKKQQNLGTSLGVRVGVGVGGNGAHTAFPRLPPTAAPQRREEKGIASWNHKV